MTDREIEARLAAAREWADYVGKPGLMAYGQSVAKDVWELIKVVEFLLEERGRQRRIIFEEFWPILRKIAFAKGATSEQVSLLHLVKQVNSAEKARAASAAAPTEKKRKKRRVAKPPVPTEGEAWGTGLNPRGAER